MRRGCLALLPLLGIACVWESVVREPEGVHKDRHHGDVPLSEQERFEAEQRDLQSTPLAAEEAGFVKRFIDERRFLKVYYVRRGAGDGHPALVMLGGLDNFEPLGRRLEPGCDLIYLQPALESVRLSDRIKDVEALRKNLVLEKIYLYGSGEWAPLALEYAAAHPDATAGVVWVAGHSDTQSQVKQRFARLAVEAPAAERARWQALADKQKFGVLDYLRSLQAGRVMPICDQAEPCRRAWHRTNDSIKSFSYPSPGPEERPEPDYWLFSLAEPDLRGYSWLEYRSVAAAEALRGVRVLMIQGRNDTITPPALAETLKQVLPDAGLEILDNSAHSPGLEEPFKVLDRVARFMDVAPLPPPSPSPLLPTWKPGYVTHDLSPGERAARAKAEDQDHRNQRVRQVTAQACAALATDDLATRLGIDAAELAAFRAELCSP